MTARYFSEILENFADIECSMNGVEATIYNRLWLLIIEGKLKSGAKLREDLIGEAFNVSRTVVRKILVIMEREGLVALPQNQGAYVATPSTGEARDVCEMVRAVGTHLVSQVSNRQLGVLNTERLKQQVKLQAAAESNRDIDMVRILAGEFHMLLAHIHGNRILATHCENLVMRLTMVSLHYNSRLPSRHSQYQARLVEKIITLDRAGAIAEFAKYFQRIAEAIEHSLGHENGDSQIDLRLLLTEPARGRGGLPR